MISLGQFWYTPSALHNFVFTPEDQAQKTFGCLLVSAALQANNLRWGGTYDADTDTVVSLVTAIGTLANGHDSLANLSLPTV